MAFVPENGPVRIRETLSDGTAHDVTVLLVPDDAVVLEGEPAVDLNGTPLPPVYYTADEAKSLKAPAKKSAASKEEAPK